MVKELLDYLDEEGVIARKNPEGFSEGDSLANEATYWFAARHIPVFFLSPRYPQYWRPELTDGLIGPKAFQLSYDQVIPKFNYEPGRWRRGPKPNQWFSTPGHERLSRDQMTATLCMLTAWRDTKRAREFTWDHLKRGLLFMPNVRRNGSLPGTPEYSWKLPDMTGPSFWSLIIRAARIWSLWPLLWILDANMVVSTVWKLMVARWYEEDDSHRFDVRNHVLSSLTMHFHYPTPWSWLNTWLMKKWPVQKYLDRWWNRDVDPPMNEHFRPLVESLFRRQD